jgi:hypothetical protein
MGVITKNNIVDAINIGIQILPKLKLNDDEIKTKINFKKRSLSYRLFYSLLTIYLIFILIFILGYLVK